MAVPNSHQRVGVKRAKRRQIVTGFKEFNPRVYKQNRNHDDKAQAHTTTDRSFGAVAWAEERALAIEIGPESEQTSHGALGSSARCSCLVRLCVNGHNELRHP